MAEQATSIITHQQPQSTNTQIDGQMISQEHQQEVIQLQCVKEPPLYKNQLQQFAQRANLGLPAYYTVNEQEPRQPTMFRSFVEVDGEKYRSLNTFPTRKAAEQDAAKIALDSILNNIKYCASKKTSDGVFPPIHEDRVFCKSILHEFAMKKNLEKPTFETTRFACKVPLFVSSLIFDGVKYVGEPTVNKKEAEQLAARAAILSVLANSGVDTVLSEIVTSKAKLISAVRGHCNADTSVSQLPNSGSDVRTSTIKEIASDDVQQTSDMIKNVTSEEHHQQSASKKARIPDNAVGPSSVIGNVSSIMHQSESHVLNNPTLQTFPQPSLLSAYHTLPQPSLLSRYPALPKPTLFPYQTLPPQTLLPNAQTISQPSMLPSTESLSQPSLLPNTQTISQQHLSLFASSQTSPQTISQPSMLLSTLSLPQSSLLPNTPTISQQHLSLLGSSQTSLQTIYQPSMLPSTQSLPQSSMFPNTQAISQQHLSSASAQTSPQTISQPRRLASTQSLPQPSLLLNTQTISQQHLSLLASSQTSPLSSLVPSTHTLTQPSLVPSTHTIPQPSHLPVTFTPSLDTQTLLNETTSSNRRKRLKKKANKKARNAMQMQTSNLPPYLVPSCNVAE